MFDYFPIRLISSRWSDKLIHFWKLKVDYFGLKKKTFFQLQHFVKCILMIYCQILRNCPDWTLFTDRFMQAYKFQDKYMRHLCILRQRTTSVYTKDFWFSFLICLTGLVNQGSTLLMFEFFWNNRLNLFNLPFWSHDHSPHEIKCNKCRCWRLWRIYN